MNKNKEGIRINRYLSSAGLCSRREADQLIRDKKVTIDGQPAVLGSLVLPGQQVKVNGQPVFKQTESIYILLYKPVGITCTTDQRRRDNIVSYLNYPERIFPVGRLDRDSEGLILMTNDGSIVNRMLRHNNRHEKEYRVTVNKKVSDDFLKKMASGVPILDTVTLPCRTWREQDTVFRIVLTQGLNRQIRRMCEALGYQVKRLIRVRIMHLEIGAMRPGEWRYLSPHERVRLLASLKDSGI